MLDSCEDTAGGRELAHLRFYSFDTDVRPEGRRYMAPCLTLWLDSS